MWWNRLDGKRALGMAGKPILGTKIGMRFIQKALRRTAGAFEDDS